MTIISPPSPSESSFPQAHMELANAEALLRGYEVPMSEHGPYSSMVSYASSPVHPLTQLNWFRIEIGTNWMQVASIRCGFRPNRSIRSQKDRAPLFVNRPFSTEPSQLDFHGPAEW